LLNLSLVSSLCLKFKSSKHAKISAYKTLIYPIDVHRVVREGPELPDLCDQVEDVEANQGHEVHGHEVDHVVRLQTEKGFK
jgi:hypothetical protein